MYTGKEALSLVSPEQARGHHTEEEAASLETEALLV